jgi:methyl-accepting chemotaxis protein
VSAANAVTDTQREVLLVNQAFAISGIEDSQADIDRVAGADPNVTKEVHVGDALGVAQGYLNSAKQSFLATRFTGDAETLRLQATGATERQRQTVSDGLASLDARRQKRIHGLQRTLWTQLSVTSFCVLVAIYLLIAFYRVMQGGIREVARQLEQISLGNLTAKPRPWGRDEVASLMKTLGSTLNALRHIVAQVREGAGEIHVSSEELAAASSDLSQRTEQTAMQLQKTAQAMANIEGTVKQTAITARGAADLVRANAGVAATGGKSSASRWTR